MNYCENCDKELNPNKMVWLELNTETGLFHKLGEVPENESQGCFPFGVACSKAVLKNGGQTKDKD